LNDAAPNTNEFKRAESQKPSTAYRFLESVLEEVVPNVNTAVAIPDDEDDEDDEEDEDRNADDADPTDTTPAALKTQTTLVVSQGGFSQAG